jgi:peptidoglycan/LPS O-acetylase OafA/YrhL
MNPSSSAIYFKNLDALRFLSFIGIFIGHTLSIPLPGNIIAEYLLSTFTFGYLAVPFFFTLSSFLITYRLLVQKEKKGNINLRDFYRNRILRIWPVYYLLLFSCFFISPLLGSVLHFQLPTLPALAPFVFFYANFYIIQTGGYFTFALVILWSISIEEQFYLVWVWILKFVKEKLLPSFIFFLFIISIAYGYYNLHIEHKPINNLNINSLFVLQYFCMGSFIALICVKKGKTFLFLENIPRIFFFVPYILLPLTDRIFNDPILLTFVRTICFGIVIFDQTFNSHRIINAGKFVFINYMGKISYGLYIYHAVIIVILEKLFHFSTINNMVPLWINISRSFILLIITTIIAHLSYQYIEKRFLALKSP